jgi:Flp pilus assembly CpaF family ATPase
LRSIVRQDPDIIMIGEMRDLETARIAIQSALTGHLVLSTLHTNNAAGGITRTARHGRRGLPADLHRQRHPGAAPGAPAGAERTREQYAASPEEIEKFGLRR